MSLITESIRAALNRCRVDPEDGRSRRIPVTQAVHWVRLEPINSALTAKTELYSIACGYAASDRVRTTKRIADITCYKCCEIAMGVHK